MNEGLIKKFNVCGAVNLLEKVADDSLDAVIIDPPYGMKIDDKKGIDGATSKDYEGWDDILEPDYISKVLSLIYSKLKAGGFLAFFHQMPYAVEWFKQIEETDFNYKEHIAWIKRVQTNTKGLQRSHENIYIYCKGSATWHTTKGFYTDVKLPLLLVDGYSLSGLDRYIKSLISKLRGKEQISKRKVDAMDEHKWRREIESDRSPFEVNFSNTWAYLPENTANRKNGHVDHPTVKPTKLLERLVLLLTPPDGVVLDCFSGSGSTAIACDRQGRDWICCDTNPEYVTLAERRVKQDDPTQEFVHENGDRQLSLWS